MDHVVGFKFILKLRLVWHVRCVSLTNTKKKAELVLEPFVQKVKDDKVGHVLEIIESNSQHNYIVSEESIEK